MCDLEWFSKIRSSLLYATVILFKVIEEERLAENSEKLGHLVRGELSAKLNPETVVKIRGKGLLNAIVINSSKGQ